MIALLCSLFSLLILFPFLNLAEEKPFGDDGENPFDHLVCREVNYGGGHHQIHQRKFLVLSGLGGGIGNYLIFYPAAYYFAAVTGRDILILDNSLIGEMCNVVRCGFPLYSEAAAVYRTILPPNAEGVRTVKTADFMNHVWRGKLIEDRVIIASGFQQKSGWYGDNEFANQCLEKLTGCPLGDISCQDRFAYERLVMGPFHSQFRDPKLQSYYHIAGIPHNLRKGILSLPHALSPRIDAAVHIRCQFSNFEWGVGPEDESWKNYVKEVDDFLNSSAFNAGIQLFQHIEKKIVEQVVEIRKLRDESKRNRHTRRRLGGGHHNPHNHSRSLGGSNSEKEEGGDEVVSFHKLTFDEKIEKEEYHGDGEHDRIFVYISSDNDRVKEAFVKYLEDHDKIAVIRVKTDQVIYHAKNVNFLSQNASIGAFNLVMDWYALSLANVMFAWRRDTHIVSTFAQSAACYSGNSAEVIIETKNGTRPINRNKEYGLEKVRAFQLITKNSVAWKEF